MSDHKPRHRRQKGIGDSKRDRSDSIDVGKKEANERPVSFTKAVSKETKELPIVKLSGGDIYQGDLSNGWRHGKGICTFRNGDVYTGEWSNNMREGEGLMVFSEGKDTTSLSQEKYQGHWTENMRNGKGQFLYSSGAEYDGEWKANIREGRGKYVFPNGDIYDGEWKNDEMNGTGTLILSGQAKVLESGSGVKLVGVQYSGQFKGGKREGKITKHLDGEDKGTSITQIWHNDEPISTEKGEIVYNNGEKYIGGVTPDGKREGKGTLELNNKSIITGNWKIDLLITSQDVKVKFISGDLFIGTVNSLYEMHGKGECKYSEGGKYNGEWVNGRPCGTGEKIESDKYTRYKGVLKDGRYHGKGTLRTKAREVAGKWNKGNLVAGHACIIYRDTKDKYEGEIDSNGKREGKGVMMYSNGDQYDGGWQGDARNGQKAIFFSAKSGNKYIVDWEKNKVKEGEGVIEYSDGGVYFGEIRALRRQGKGVMFYPPQNKEEILSKQSDFSLLIDSLTTDGIPDVAPYGSLLVSQWANDQTEDCIVLRKYDSGDVYKGQMKNGKRNGDGLLLYGSGSRYEGQFVDNARHGTGTFTDVEHDRIESGQWEYNVFVS